MNRPAAKVSVIIPVYNGEKYLAQTLDSVIKQTFTCFEVICVNDCSTDSSLSILRTYEGRDSRIRCLTTESNLGIVSKVLNYAIPYMRGDFYVYSSQDDLFSEDWLEKMFNRAKCTNADAVIPDLVFYHERTIAKNRVLVGVRGNREVVLSNRDAVVLSLDWTIPGNALWNASLVRRIRYEEFGLNADEYSARVFFLNCNKIVFSEGTFYYRQDNAQAITKKLTYKTFDIPYASFRLYQFLRKNGFESEVCGRVLMNAVMGLMRMNQVLLREKVKTLVARKAILSSDDQVKARERIMRCYNCFDRREIYGLVVKQQCLKKAIVRLAIIGGYTMFNILCVAALLHGILVRAVLRLVACIAPPQVRR